MKTKKPIAIIGLSCRFPQADNLQAFWNILINGVDTVSEMPGERWEIDKYYDPDITVPGKTHQRHGAFLKNIHHFDPFAFNISPAEATEMNPSQKLMLELVWEALENSTLPTKKALGSKTGVYIGNIWSDFEHLRKAKYADVTSHSAMGQSANVIANRVSYTYGFTGPSLVVDTGCSSSLVALHIACQALWDESIEMGVVGGVNHILDPDQYVLLSKFGGLSKKGKCSTFDADADGFVRGEGAGIIIVKTLSQAEADGDHIFAVIRGVAMNNNGFNENLPATSVKGQLDVLKEAYKYSGIDPSEIHYVEAHGTGTKLGDPVETKALGTFFGKKRIQPLSVGSVKTNIGHLEAAAGIAGMIKVILAMQHRVLPQNINLNTPNPNINFEALKVKAITESTPWPVKNGETLKAGVNSFGWGGTNAHVVIEEYRDKQSETVKIETPQYLLLPLSAKSEQALLELAKIYLKLIEENKDKEDDWLTKLCVAASSTRSEFEYRLAFKGRDKKELTTDLRSFISENTGVASIVQKAGPEKTVFIFPGQGSQWLGMGKELYASEPVFKDVLDECNKAFAKYVSWDLIEEIHASEEKSHMTEIDVIQPSICAVQIALAKLWESKGVVPSAVVGHSMGEVAAAYFAGAISLDNAAKIICTRSKLMKTLSGKGGAMAVTELSWDDALEVVKEYDGKLSLAVYNSPKSTVLAGDQETITKVLTDLESKDLFCRQVKVDVASHSPQMDAIKDELGTAVKDITPTESRLKIYSTVRNQSLAGTEFNADYWMLNLRSTVQFASVIRQLTDDDYTVFVEVSPHPVLTTAVKECGEAFKKDIVSAHSTLRDEAEIDELIKNFTFLYQNGVSVSWENYFNISRIPYIQLPAYPFQRDRYEIEDRSHEHSFETPSDGHLLLGNDLAIAGEENIHIWETRIHTNSLPYIKGHKVNSTVVYPGVAYVEAALAAANTLFGKGKHEIMDIVFKNTLVLSDSSPVTVQLKLKEREANNIFDFSFFSKTRKDDDSYVWTLLADGKIRMNTKDVENILPVNTENKAQISYTGEKYYELLQQLGLHYSDYFAGISDISIDETSASAVVIPNENLKNAPGNYYFHPALLDSCLHVLFARSIVNSGDQDEKATFLTRVGKLTFLSPIEWKSKIHVEAVFKGYSGETSTHQQTINADLVISQENGNKLAVIENAEATILDSKTILEEQNALNEWLYRSDWERLDDKILSGTNLKPAGTWLIFNDSLGVGNRVANNLATRGYHCMIVDTPDTAQNSGVTDHENKVLPDYSKNSLNGLFPEIIKKNADIDGIVFCTAINSRKDHENFSTEDIYSSQRENTSQLINIIQVLTEYPEMHQPKIAVVTNGLVNTSENDPVVNITQPALWGVARVMTNELTENDCLRIDLSDNPSQLETDHLTDLLLLEKAGECELALRENEIYTARLVKNTESTLNLIKPVFTGTATYLITGFRGLGMVLLNWMADQGAKNFALLSRSGNASYQALQQIEALRAKGANIRIFKADVADHSAMQKVFETIDDEMPPLKGVFHAAGTIKPETLDKLSIENFDSVLSPKTEGAWNLHLLTRNKRLNWFVMFSSVSSLIGLSGQASYVAGNTFLDFLAQYRKKLKLPALSVNWGVIKDVGMVANMTELNKFAKAEGFELVSMDDALQVFEKIANTRLSQIGIFKMDPVKLTSYYSALGKTGYMSALLHDPGEDSNTDTGILESVTRLQTDEERVELLTDIIITDIAKLIKAASSKISRYTTFKSLGIDSIMLVQLRNKFEKDYQIKLSVTSFWTHPSIQTFVEFLYTQLKPVLEDEIVSTEKEIKDRIEEMNGELESVAKTQKELDDMSIDELNNEMDNLLNNVLSD